MYRYVRVSARSFANADRYVDALRPWLPPYLMIVAQCFQSLRRNFNLQRWNNSAGKKIVTRRSLFRRSFCLRKRHAQSPTHDH